jgi:hypothetical protein
VKRDFPDYIPTQTHSKTGQVLVLKAPGTSAFISEYQQSLNIVDVYLRYDTTTGSGEVFTAGQCVQIAPSKLPRPPDSLPLEEYKILCIDKSNSVKAVLARPGAEEALKKPVLLSSLLPITVENDMMKCDKSNEFLVWKKELLDKYPKLKQKAEPDAPSNLVAVFTNHSSAFASHYPTRIRNPPRDASLSPLIPGRRKKGAPHKSAARTRTKTIRKRRSANANQTNSRAGRSKKQSIPSVPSPVMPMPLQRRGLKRTRDANVEELPTSISNSNDPDVISRTISYTGPAGEHPKHMVVTLDFD